MSSDTPATPRKPKTDPKTQLYVGIQSCVKTEYTKHINCPTTLYTNHHFMFLYYES
jgi:hypothetical protein